MEELKNLIKQAVVKIASVKENSRSLSLANTKLEEACMWVDYHIREQAALNGQTTEGFINVATVKAEAAAKCEEKKIEESVPTPATDKTTEESAGLNI